MNIGGLAVERPINDCLDCLEYGFIGSVNRGVGFIPPRSLNSLRWLTETMKQCLHAFFSGRVQGVGFRYTVNRLVHGFDVTGVVRNLDDGRVELLAEGDRPELEAFLEAIQVSELASFIRQTQVDWSEAHNQFTGFNIAR